jgi:hypothetical protein
VLWAQLVRNAQREQFTREYAARRSTTTPAVFSHAVTALSKVVLSDLAVAHFLVRFDPETPQLTGRRDVACFLVEQLGTVEAVNLDGGPEVSLALGGARRSEAIATPGMRLPLIVAVLAEEPAAWK